MENMRHFKYVVMATDSNNKNRFGELEYCSYTQFKKYFFQRW